MKIGAVTGIAFAAIAVASTAVAGTDFYSGKEVRQTTASPPQDCWYNDNEWNVSLWGTYALTATSSRPIGAPQFFLGQDRGDRYLQTDHAWGGGIDAKYFWHKYFGLGVEGFALDAPRTRFDFNGAPAGPFVFTKSKDERAVGSILGTFTLRFPIGCSRFAPYVFAGGGGLFGGGERDHVFETPAGSGTFGTRHPGPDSKKMGQFGAGFEVRLTKHIGWMNDFSWNVADTSHNNFGMVRTGLNLAF